METFSSTGVWNSLTCVGCIPMKASPTKDRRGATSSCIQCAHKIHHDLTGPQSFHGKWAWVVWCVPYYWFNQLWVMVRYLNGQFQM